MSNWTFNKAAHSSYVHDLPLPEDEVLVEYVYIVENGESLQSKCRKLRKVPKKPSDVPVWSYAANYPVEDRFLKPVALYKDPMRRGNHRMVLCETYANDWTPAPRNFRAGCDVTMTTDAVSESEPWFGLEQEYTMVDHNKRAIGWPSQYLPQPEEPYHHDAVGMFQATGRDLYEAHLFACMYAGINISGGNAEAFPGQWEFQVGPTIGTKAADDLWMARYLLHRLGEEFGIGVSFHPKLMPHKYGACGGHINISTKAMREEGGLEVIHAAIPRLERTHERYLDICDPSGGRDNQARLQGYYCTSTKEFTWGVENRDAAVRISRQVVNDGKGFMEDRRPASNFDPYLVCDALVKIIVLEDEDVKNPYALPRAVKLAVPTKEK